MPSLSHVSPTKFGLALSSALRRYSTSSPSFYPALASTTSTTQPKNSPSKLAHEWKESTATLSEADVKADRDAIDAELHSAKVEREIAAFGETGWKKAFWAD